MRLLALYLNSSILSLPPILADDEDEYLPLHFFAFFLCNFKAFSDKHFLPQQSHVSTDACVFKWWFNLNWNDLIQLFAASEKAFIFIGKIELH